MTRRQTERILNDAEHRTRVATGLPTGARHPCQEEGRQCDSCLRTAARERGWIAEAVARAIRDNDGVRG